MASLEFCDKHNMVAYLEKSEGREGFHQIIDFLTLSHIHYALTESPTLYASPVEQFWQTATLCTTKEEVMAITATIDRKVKLLVTEASIRRHLKLEDSEGLNTLPTAEIFEQLALMGNMKRASKGYFGVIHPLFETMLAQHQADEPSIQALHETYPSRITSSPSLSPQRHPSTSQSMHITHDTKEPASMPHDSPLQSVHSLECDEGTHLRVKKLEKQVKTTKDRRRARIVLSEDEDAAKDSSKQGRKISEIDKDPTISLVQSKHAKETSWFQEDIEIQEKISDDTKVVIEEKEPTELLEDQGSGEKGEKEVSTVGAEHSTVIPVVNTATANLVYIRRSAEKRKVKGKTIMREDESVQKKSKKQLEQERLGHEEAIRLQEQIDEEERQRMARDAEIAR
ncbi:hypothetical protein Tco_0145658 [Tanacetum coccineum]